MASQVDAARNLLPYAVDVALKDVRLYPNRSNSVTIWGKPIGDGSVDYDTILPLLHQLLPDPDKTSCHIKLRLSPDTTLDDTHAWMSRSAPADPPPTAAPGRAHGPVYALMPVRAQVARLFAGLRHFPRHRRQVLRRAGVP